MFWTYFVFASVLGCGYVITAVLVTICKELDGGPGWFVSFLTAAVGALFFAIELSWLDSMNILARLGA